MEDCSQPVGIKLLRQAETVMSLGISIIVDEVN